MNSATVAIIGAGPVGLEAALEAVRRGYDVSVYEAGRVGEHLRWFGWVRLFTPFGKNSTEAGRSRLRQPGLGPFAGDRLLTAADFLRDYLSPIADIPELRGRIHEHSRVTHAGREGISKTRGILAAGDSSRSSHAFLLRIESPDGAASFETADIVIDASGVYGNPNATGPGGLPAVGEDRLGERIERHIPLMGQNRDGRNADAWIPPRRILLIGDGHSAATLLAELESRFKRGSRSVPEVVHWVHRERGRDRVFAEIAGDPLPARRELAERANGAGASGGWLARHAGASVVEYSDLPGGAIRATLRFPWGEKRLIEVDRVVALVGYRPDTAISRELQVHLCYASEGPMNLSAAILTASLAGPGNAGDCLSQTAHGAETLRNPEPDFYIVGAKSYGRNPNFLLTIGHQQVLDVFSLIEAGESARAVGSSATR